MAKTKSGRTHRSTIRAAVRRAPNKKLKEAAKKHEDSDFLTFTMDSGQFEHCIRVIISDNLEKCSKYVNEYTERCDFAKEDFQCLGKVFISRTKCPILWLPSIPSNVEEQGTLAHELLHLVVHVTEWAGVSLSKSSEEVYTHLLKYYYKQFFSHAKSN